MVAIFRAMEAYCNGNRSAPVMAELNLLKKALSCKNMDACIKSGKKFCVENCPEYRGE